MQALVATKDKDASDTKPSPNYTKLNKPPPKKADDPEVLEFEGRTWKWCDKCFRGCWNRTHVTNKHQPGKGRNKNRRPPPTTDDTPNTTTPSPSPQANIAATTSSDANVANSSNYTMDFV